MEFKLKVMAAAVAFATAGVANAALQSPDTTGGGGFVFEAWSAALGKSFSQQLGSQTYDNIVGTGTPTGSANVVGFTTSGNDKVFGLDSSFATQFGTATDIQWHVVSAKNNLATGPNGLLMTWTSNTNPTINNNAINSATSGATTAFNNINTLMGTNTFGTAQTTGDPAYAGRSNWGGNFGVALTGGSNGISGYFTGPIVASTQYTPGTGVGSFFAIFNSGSGLSQAGKQQLGVNGTTSADWILQANGTLTYHTAAAVSAVPLPAAAWLFGSGLLGLIGIGRRRRENA